MSKNNTQTRAEIFAALPEAGTAQVITSEKVDKIFGALAKAQGAVQAAIRSQTAEDGPDKYDYADLDDVIEAIKTAASENGLAVFDRFPKGQKSLQSILVHESGQWMDYGLYELGTPPTHKEKGSAITYGRRHMRKCIFGIADRDDDATDAGTIKEAPPEAEAPPAEPKPGFKPKDSLRPHKDDFALTVPVTPAGQLDYDHFAAEIEQKIIAETDGVRLSLWNRANSKTLDRMEKERPDLFKAISDAFTTKGQQLM